MSLTLLKWFYIYIIKGEEIITQSYDKITKSR